MASRMHGSGRFEWPDGTSFEGKYEHDKKNGPGLFAWPGGSKSIGIWKDGKQNGIGTHVTAKNEHRKGKWNMGKLEMWLDPDPTPIHTIEFLESLKSSGQKSYRE